MKQTIVTRVVLSTLAVVSVAGDPRMDTAAEQARPSPAREAPKFQVDPAWPKIPNNWQFGQVASVSIDATGSRVGAAAAGHVEPGGEAQGRASVAGVRRGRQFHPGMGRTRARATSGPIPSTASTSIPKGFVWIGGNGAKDHQILKFTKAGKFVMQIGRAGQSKGNADTQNLNQPADTFVSCARRTSCSSPTATATAA